MTHPAIEFIDQLLQSGQLDSQYDAAAPGREDVEYHAAFAEAIAPIARVLQCLASDRSHTFHLTTGDKLPSWTSDAFNWNINDRLVVARNLGGFNSNGNPDADRGAELFGYWQLLHLESLALSHHPNGWTSLVLFFRLPRHGTGSIPPGYRAIRLFPTGFHRGYYSVATITQNAARDGTTFLRHSLGLTQSIDPLFEIVATDTAEAFGFPQADRFLADHMDQLVAYLQAIPDPERAQR